MTTPNSIERPGSSLTREWLGVARFYLSNRRAVLALAAIAVVAGFAFNWNWLVATGLAPVLLTLLPCAVMCGLGLCFHKLFGASSASEQHPRTLVAEQTEGLSAPSNPAAIDLVANCCNDATNEAATVQPKSNADNERRDSHA